MIIKNSFYASVRKPIPAAMICMLVFLTFTSCASLYSPKKGIKLSDAAREAEKEPDKQEVLKPDEELLEDGREFSENQFEASPLILPRLIAENDTDEPKELTPYQG